MYERVHLPTLNLLKEDKRLNNICIGNANSLHSDCLQWLPHPERSSLLTIEGCPGVIKDTTLTSKPGVSLLGLQNLGTMRRRWQNREISAVMVVSVVKWSKVAQRLLKEDIKAAGVWYHSSKWVLTVDGSCAGDGATLRASAATCPCVATAHAHTVPETTSTMAWGAMQSKTLSVAIPAHQRSAITAKETRLLSAAGAQRWLRLQKCCATGRRWV